MRRIIQFCSLIWVICFHGCMGPSPEKEDIIGKWVAQTGAELNFYADSSFSGQLLPGGIFWTSDYVGQAFDGSGTWKIQKGAGFWELRIIFNQTTLSGMESGFGNYILLSKEGTESWYLFKWMDNDVGGNRFKFIRQ